VRPGTGSGHRTKGSTRGHVWSLVGVQFDTML